jgi:hypothetical protein
MLVAPNLIRAGISETHRLEESLLPLSQVHVENA